MIVFIATRHLFPKNTLQTRSKNAYVIIILQHKKIPNINLNILHGITDANYCMPCLHARPSLWANLDQIQTGVCPMHTAFV